MLASHSNALAFLLVLALPLLALIGALLQSSYELGSLTRDPALVMGGRRLYGLFSHLGVLALWSAAAWGVLVAALWRVRGIGAPGLAQALGWGALLSGLLSLDDLFMIHETVEVRLARAFGMEHGLPLLQLLVYSPILLLFVRKVVPVLHRTAWPLLALSLAGFAATQVLDLAQDFDLLALPCPDDSCLFLGRPPRSYVHFLEDAPKFVGICAWAAYHFDLAWRMLTADAR